MKKIILNKTQQSTSPFFEVTFLRKHRKVAFTVCPLIDMKSTRRDFADVIARPRKEQTPLVIAVLLGYVDRTVQRLQSGPAINGRNYVDDRHHQTSVCHQVMMS